LENTPSTAMPVALPRSFSAAYPTSGNFQVP